MTARLIAVVAHELQHALEIARAPQVRRSDDVAAGAVPNETDAGARRRGDRLRQRLRDLGVDVEVKAA